MTEQTPTAKPAKAKWKLGRFTFTAADCRDGVLVDPDLPPRFDSTANDDRPDSHRKFWGRPYIVTQDGERPGFVVRCLDGGAWDRSTNWGKFPTLEEAVKQAKSGSPY